MPIPKQSEIEQPLLQVLRALGGRAAPRDVYEPLERCFEDLTEADKAELLSSGVSRWRNRVQFVRQNLVTHGLIDGSERGVWRLTVAGEQRAERAAAGGADAETPSQVDSVAPTAPSVSSGDPLAAGTADLLARRDAHEELQRERLLARLRALHWRDFEHLTGKLLEAYGVEDVVVTQASNDGGIDGFGNILTGIIKMRVAFQCKLTRRRLDRPEVDKFRGAIQGDFEQGLLVTTSDFTVGAKLASHRMGSARIVLIDGDELVRKMFDKGIGVVRRELAMFEDAPFPGIE